MNNSDPSSTVTFFTLFNTNTWWWWCRQETYTTTTSKFYHAEKYVIFTDKGTPSALKHSHFFQIKYLLILCIFNPEITTQIGSDREWIRIAENSSRFQTYINDKYSKKLLIWQFSESSILISNFGSVFMNIWRSKIWKIDF